MKHILRLLLAPILALSATILILILSSPEPERTLAAFFVTPFSSWWHTGNMLNTMTLLLFAAAGSLLAMKGGTFNLGGEAQIYAPALVTAVLLVQEGNPYILIPLSLAAALLTGAFLGLIPGVLKARYGIDELISSFLLSASLIPLLDYLIAGPLRDQTRNLLATPLIPERLRLTAFLPPSYFNTSFVAAIVAIAVITLLLARTKTGISYEIAGKAPEFARFSGFPVARMTVLSMTLAGALHAITGYSAIRGTWYTCHQGFSGGMGWSALAVALIARKSLPALIPAAFFFSWLQTASTTATLASRFSFDPLSLIQAIIFLVIAAQRFLVPSGKRSADTP